MRARLDKYRINPGNVGTGKRRDEQFTTICQVAVDQGKPIRIGVNGGSLNQELVMRRMQENTDQDLGLSSDEILNECMVQSALESTELALEAGLAPEQIILSCKVSRPRHLVAVYRELARRTRQPLHLGLTEAGMGTKGLVWSASAMGDPPQRGHRRHHPRLADARARRRSPRGSVRRVRAAAGARPAQLRAERHGVPRLRPHHQQHLPGARRARAGLHPRADAGVEDAQYTGVESLTLAVMGCVVNGPGESKASNIGISLPGTGEAPHCPVFIDGVHATTLRGTYEELFGAFQELVDDYVRSHYARLAPVTS